MSAIDSSETDAVKPGLLYICQNTCDAIEFGHSIRNDFDIRHWGIFCCVGKAA